MAEKKRKDKGRKWQITINNPLDYGYDHNTIIKILDGMKLTYYCLCDEIGIENNTPHTHIYIYRDSTIRFDTIKKRFPEAHIELCYGTSKENRDYIRKEGKYADSDKKETNLIDTFYEFGALPQDNDKKLDNKILLQKLIDEGYTDEEIIRQHPQFTYRLNEIKELRYTLLYTKYQTEQRDIKVIYISGETATGKSKFVHDLFDASEIYVVNDYDHPFDNYMGQRVIIFDEFRSSLRYGQMLQLLDKYPCQLSARYSNKWACYEYAFVLSNIPIEHQYYHLFEDVASQKAFYRRFTYVAEFKKEYLEDIDVYDYCQTWYRGNETLNDMEECEAPIFISEVNDED